MEESDLVKECQNFHKTWTTQQEEEERRFQKTYQTYQDELKKMKERTDELYKNFLQWTIEHVDHDESNTFLTVVKEMIDDVNKNPYNMQIYSEILSDTMEMIQKRKPVCVCEDKKQYPYGKKPLYFDFMD